MNEQEHNGDERDEPKLSERLAQTGHEVTPVPRAVDDAVLSAAGAHLRSAAAGRQERVGRWHRWIQIVKRALAGASGTENVRLGGRFATAVATAAVLVGLAILGSVALFSDRGGLVVREDVDRNGRVNVLDAMMLARRVENGAVEKADDLNGDGVVDRLDVDWVAHRAVRLEEGPRS